MLSTLYETSRVNEDILTFSPFKNVYEHVMEIRRGNKVVHGPRTTLYTMTSVSYTATLVYETFCIRST